jgi:hypothetical protein
MHRTRRIVSALCATGLLAAVTALPALAATTTAYTATMPQEKTIQRTCPAGVPQGAFCFTGSDHSRLGSSVPGGAPATEDFAGYVDFSHPIANACVATPQNPSTTGFPDHNVVSITTPRGLVIVRTDGTDCQSTGTDDGTFTILAGTGIFQGATGTGHVHTQATGGTGTAANPITSATNYAGTVTLR